MISGIFRALVRFFLFKPTITKLGEKKAIKLGLTIFLIAFFLVGFSINLVMFFGLMMVISFAASLTRGPLNSKISQSVSPAEQGKINGYSSGLDSFAQIIGPLLGTFMLNFFEPYFLSFLISSIALVPFLMGYKTIELKKYNIADLSREKMIEE
ncbi:MAG: MFS transporter [Candidatus Odinarchaeota archaeon]